jgi:hypothetical protein
MGTRCTQLGLINGMQPLDGFRLFMFHTAYNKMFASVSDMTLRFAKALVYSSQSMTPEQEKHATTYKQEVARLTAEMEKEREARLAAEDEDEGQDEGGEEEEE